MIKGGSPRVALRRQRGPFPKKTPLPPPLRAAPLPGGQPPLPPVRGVRHRPFSPRSPDRRPRSSPPEGVAETKRTFRAAVLPRPFLHEMTEKSSTRHSCPMQNGIGQAAPQKSAVSLRSGRGRLRLPQRPPLSLHAARTQPACDKGRPPQEPPLQQIRKLMPEAGSGVSCRRSFPERTASKKSSPLPG